jgi:hypothetical protein
VSSKVVRLTRWLPVLVAIAAAVCSPVDVVLVLFRGPSPGPRPSSRPGLVRRFESAASGWGLARSGRRWVSSPSGDPPRPGGSSESLFSGGPPPPWTSNKSKITAIGDIRALGNGQYGGRSSRSTRNPGRRCGFSHVSGQRSRMDSAGSGSTRRSIRNPASVAAAHSEVRGSRQNGTSNAAPFRLSRRSRAADHRAAAGYGDESSERVLRAFDPPRVLGWSPAADRLVRRVHRFESDLRGPGR